MKKVLLLLIASTSCASLMGMESNQIVPFPSTASYNTPPPSYPSPSAPSLEIEESIAPSSQPTLPQSMMNAAGQTTWAKEIAARRASAKAIVRARAEQPFQPKQCDDPCKEACCIVLLPVTVPLAVVLASFVCLYKNCTGDNDLDGNCRNCD